MSTSKSLGKLVHHRALTGVKTEISLKAGDTVTIHGTQIWSTESDDGGKKDTTGWRREGSANPNWSMYLTFPTGLPQGDTIRVYTKRGKKTNEYYTEQYPHPTKDTTLGGREDLHFFDRGDKQHSYFASPNGSLVLCPPSVILNRPLEKPQTWTILANDQIWAEPEGRPGTKIDLMSKTGEDCVYEMTDEVPSDAE